jgi:uncharacterized membrane protein (DUF4010 family)
MPKGEAEPGQTTEFTALVMYGIGVWVVVGSMPVAVALAGTVAVLLHVREPLHELWARSARRTSRPTDQAQFI